MHFREGRSPKGIVESFPTLPLSQAYGATAYYLENQTAVDGRLAEGERELQRSVPPLSRQATEFYARLEAARRQTQPKRS